MFALPGLWRASIRQPQPLVQTEKQGQGYRGQGVSDRTEREAPGSGRAVWAVPKA